ncbi:MAG: hypothetical protein AB7K09_15330 [Planctomycetota bacterium]
MPVAIDDSSSNALTPGLRAEFDSVYRTRLAEDAWWKRLFRTVPARGAYEIFHGFNSVPVPQVWLRGDARARKGFTDFSKTVYVYDYELTVDWHENDERDERSGDSLVARVREGASRLANHDELALADMINGSASYLHPATDFNCFDSYPLFSASHATRSGGNIVSGSGVVAADAIKTDWFNVLQAFREMQDTEGEPYWRDALDRARFLVVAPPQLEEVMTEAFESSMILPDGANAPVPNVLPKKARTDLVIWERLGTASNDWYVFVTGTEQLPFLKLERQGVRVREWNFENSDRASETKMKGMGWDIRVGYGALNHHTTIQVNN